MAEVFDATLPYRINGTSVMVYVVDSVYDDHTTFRSLSTGGKVAIFHDEANRMKAVDIEDAVAEEKRTGKDVDSLRSHLSFITADHEQWEEALRMLTR